MMTRKQWIAVAITFAGFAFVCALALAVLIFPRFSVAKGNYDRIRDGMSQTEVEQLFGCKPISIPCAWLGTGGVHVETWHFQDGSAANVHFVGDSVFLKTWTPSTDPPLEKIRRWLHFPSASPQVPVGSNQIRNGPFTYIR
jgi:hypothetical protein